MLVFSFILNYLVCLLLAYAMIRRLLSERETAYVELYEAFFAGTLLYCVETYFFVEILSVFNALGTPYPLASAYALSSLVILSGVYRHRQSLSKAWRAWCHAPFEPFLRKIVFLIAVLLFLPLLFIAVVYPPCTADSMSYHLPRILHWIQNGNVATYPTEYLRQLYVQPFAEYLVLPWELMVGGDYFDNTVQIVAFAGDLLMLSLLIRHFGGGAYCQMLGCAVLLSSPIVIFEAPTTQTDLILTFFFFGFVYCGLKLSSPLPGRDRLFYALGMAVSLGLSLNTKLSIAPLELPFCAWFGWRFLVLYRKKVWPIYLTLVTGFLVFNAPYYLRNHEVSGSFFGPVRLQNQVRNERFGPDVVFSNTLRNIGMQLMMPVIEINEFNRAVLISLHEIFDMKWNDPATSYMGSGTVPFEYDVSFVLDDYRSGNTLIILLFMIVTLGVGGRAVCRFAFPLVFSEKPIVEPVKRKERRKAVDKPEDLPGETKGRVSYLIDPGWVEKKGELAVFTWLMFFGFLLFSGFFRWQPFGSRLLLPVTLGQIPFIAVGCCRMLENKRIVQLTLLTLLISFLYTVFLVSNSLFFDPIEPLISFNYTPVEDAKTAPADTVQTGNTVNPPSPEQDAERREVDANVSLKSPKLVEDYFRNDRPYWENYRFHRNYKYFRVIKMYLADYLSISNKIAELEVENVGIALDLLFDRWEYPFWPILRSKIPNVRIEWVVFPDYLKKTRNYDPDFVPDVIITDMTPDIITSRFDVTHVWKYEHLVLALVGRDPGDFETPSESETPLEPTEQVSPSPDP